MFVPGEGLGHVFDHLQQLDKLLTDRGLFFGFILNHPARILPEGRRQSVSVPALEKDKIPGRFGGGVLLLSEVNAVFPGHFLKAMVFSWNTPFPGSAGMGKKKAVTRRRKGHG